MEANPYFPQHSQGNPEGCEGHWRGDTLEKQTRSPGAGGPPGCLHWPGASLSALPQNVTLPCPQMVSRSPLLSSYWRIQPFRGLHALKADNHTTVKGEAPIPPKAIRQAAENHRASHLGFSKTVKPYKNSTISEISNAKSHPLLPRPTGLVRLGN